MRWSWVEANERKNFSFPGFCLFQWLKRESNLSFSPWNRKKKPEYLKELIQFWGGHLFMLLIDEHKLISKMYKHKGGKKSFRSFVYSFQCLDGRANFSIFRSFELLFISTTLHNSPSCIAIGDGGELHWYFSAILKRNPILNCSSRTWCADQKDSWNLDIRGR